MKEEKSGEEERKEKGKEQNRNKRSKTEGKGGEGRKDFALKNPDCFGVSCSTISCLGVSCSTISFLGVSCSTISCLGVSCSTISCLGVSCSMISCFRVSCSTISCLGGGGELLWGELLHNKLPWGKSCGGPLTQTIIIIFKRKLRPPHKRYGCVVCASRK